MILLSETGHRAISELQLENEDLKASIKEYKQTIEIIIEKHLTQMVRMLRVVSPKRVNRTQKQLWF